MVPYRLNRLFRRGSGRCVNVAVDHGAFGEGPFLQGIEDMGAVVERLVEAGPDAIQLAVGQAPLLQGRPGGEKPALVLRTDVANVYGRDLPHTLFSVLLEDAVGQAVRLDAACVVVNLFDIPGEPALRQQCIRNVSLLRAACDQVGMPLMVEPLAMRPGSAGGYGVEGDVDRICSLVRQAVELGADVIKADPTDPLEEYHRVTEVARVPVLVRGGGRQGDREILQRTHALVAQGAAGIVYGRNIIQHPSPTAMTHALMAIIHDAVTPEDALRVLGTPT
jgi:fructose-bisphosphate aldolase, class I